ncbi:MAG: FAD-dependent oxidoreductase [Psychrosphaera sp.]|nr:FAD-dependent oxidoreductase [Psychrosphaera sp.]
MTFDIIIIGSGLAGYTLVKDFRRLNKSASILMISADDGCYYSKPMLSTGFAKHKSAADLAMQPAAKMAETLDITIYASTQVVSIDRAAKTLMVENGSQSIGYNQALVFATGAEPARIPLPDALDGRCFTINDLADYGQFREHLGGHKNVTIIGSGLVGTEYANDMCDGGLNISVISLEDAPLQLLLPKALSVNVQEQLANKGISFHFNTSISDAALTEDGQLQLELTDGTSINCDLVLSATGLRPRIELAKSSGITVDRGIVVNETLKTCDDNIYSLGDCAQINGLILMYVAPLAACSKALAKTLNGDLTAVSIPASPVIVKTPACPVVSSPPPMNATGEWQIEGEAPDMKACFVAEDGSLLGFGLTGKKVMERMKLAKRLPAIL